jgi:hypothetical protein
MLRTLAYVLFATQVTQSLRINKDGKLYQVFGIDFAKFLKANPVALFVLYDSSSLSEFVIPSLHQLEADLASNGLSLVIAKMSVKDAPSYSKLWHVSSFPHFRLYIGDGIYDDFREYPNIENIKTWITTIISNEDSIRLIDDDKKADLFREEDFAFYLRFPSDKESQFLPIHRKFQKLDSKLKVFYANKALHDPFESYNPKELVVGFRRTFDDGDKFFSSEKKLNLATIHNFFELFRHPEIHHLTAEVSDKIRTMGIRSIIYFDKVKRGEVLTQFKRAAGFYHKAMRFVIADLTDSHGQSFAEEAKVSIEGRLPQIRIVDFIEGRKRVFEVIAKSEGEIAEAIEAYNKGELKDLTGESYIASGEL